MMKTLLGAAAVALIGAPAMAAVVVSFDAGLATPSAGYTVIDTFDNLDNVTVNYGTVLIMNPPATSNGAPPANSVPAGTSYLSVLGGGSATIYFAPDTKSFQFDWGSIDTYNTLTVTSSTGIYTIVPGSSSFPNTADGNQHAHGTNGRVTVWGDVAGETFSSITLTSGTNSFEIDNLATIAVPEPATWAMLIVGFGLVGFAARRREQRLARAIS
ncbi:Npun_F0296 family exosortase-dependent surface protein [Sandaracinobacter neustonicus]|nr:PEPxxWA-CTERM sorting domain-containing protein [Sandaracinobacter neustonicus]